MVFFPFFILSSRSIGLHQEAEYIEQQLKMKQGSGQPVPMPAGMFVYFVVVVVQFNILIL